MASNCYYNEHDPFAAAWLRELIAWGLIAPGDVDERSIEDVCADDLRGYAQHHFFAGIGVWSAALRGAGWPDDRPVWTGSCPCQPFSASGKRKGFDDPRHLWPHWFRLIAERRPHQVFGEQVDRAGEWVDLVRTDLESLGAAFASIDLPAAGFEQGPHRRQRFYWMADLHHAERWSDMAGGHFGDWPQAGRVQGYGQPGTGVSTGGVAHGSSSRRAELEERDGGPSGRSDWETPRRHDPVRRGDHVGLGHHHHQGPPQRSWTPDSVGAVRVEGPAAGATGSLLGCDWLLCHDARVRPVEAGTFPLAATSPDRLGLLRGYGNALDYQTALNFVGAFLEAELLL